MEDVSLSMKDEKKLTLREIWERGYGPRNKSEYFILYLKGFAMGIADLIPGVSGGTIAFITGIYEQLLEAISSVNKELLSKVLRFQIKEALCDIRLRFLIPLFFGILTAMFSLARVMHYMMSEHTVHTWSLFFGLIGASIIVLGRQLHTLKSFQMMASIVIGTVIAYAVVSLIPVDTPETWWFIIICGLISISAMILPGISGSFLLLILGKYAYITGAVKNPFAPGALEVMLLFVCGAVVGLLAFSKFLNWCFKHYHNVTMALLTGFLLGSMKKVWPWKQVTESVVIRGEVRVLQEANVMPSAFDSHFAIAVGLMIFGFALVLILESFSRERTS